MSTKLCKAHVLGIKGIFIFLVNKDILVPVSKPCLGWHPPGIRAECGGLMSFSGSSCADGRGYCSQMLVIASLLEGSAPSDPQVELFHWVQRTPAPAAWMRLARAKGENEQCVLIWLIWTRRWNQLHKRDADICSKNYREKLRALTFFTYVVIVMQPADTARESLQRRAYRLLWNTRVSLSHGIWNLASFNPVLEFHIVVLCSNLLRYSISWSVVPPYLQAWSLLQMWH